MPLRNTRAIHPRLIDSVRRSAVADRGLPDECTITRPSHGQGTVDPATAVWTPGAGQLVFEGPCRVQPDTRARGHEVDTGDISITLHRYRASIPWDGDQVLVNDVLTVTCTEDPQLAGRHLMIRDVKYDTFQVRRFLDLEDHPDLLTEEP